MKILEIIATLGIGGAEALVVDLSSEFSSMGEDVRVHLLGGVRGVRGERLASRCEMSGVELIGKPPRSTKSFRNLMELTATVRAFRPDIVHCHMYTSEVAGMVGKCLSFSGSSLSVRTLHSSDVFTHRSRLIYRILAGTFDVTVACAEPVRKAFERSAIGGNGARKLWTIPNGCTLSPSGATPEEKGSSRAAIGLPADALVVSHIGAFRGPSLEMSHKGHGTLLHAFSRAFGRQKGAWLVCAGDGTLRGEAEALALRLGVADRVRFLGNVPEPWPVLQASDIFIFPSRLEGLPLALLEAGSAGIPIIVSDIPEIRAVHAGPGWHFCPPGDADAFSATLLRVSGELARQTALAEAASAEIRDRFSIASCAREYLALFRELGKGV